MFMELGAAYLKEKRLKNLIGNYWDYYASLRCKKSIVRHYPAALMIEPTNICNLKCPLCPSGNGSLKRARGMMELGFYQQIVDQVADKTGMLILWNQGESFLNPQFYQMLLYAAQKGFYTLASTNASLDLDHEAILRSGLSKLIISMDGISKASYDQYRINGNFEKVLYNLKELMRLKKKTGAKSPRIVWQFIVMKHNEHEIEEVKRLAKEYQVDKLELKTAQIYSVEDLKYLPTDHKYSRYQYDAESFQLKTRLLNRCRRLWNQPVINWDGELSICCYDKDLLFRIGNLKEHSFEALWFGEGMQRMRQNILNNRSQIGICQNCGEGIIQRL